MLAFELSLTQVNEDNSNIKSISQIDFNMMRTSPILFAPYIFLLSFILSGCGYKELFYFPEEMISFDYLDF